MDCPSAPGAPLFPFTLSQTSQTSCFEIWNGLPDAFSPSTRLLPVTPVDLANSSHGRPCPFAPPPLQGLHRYYEPVRRRARRRYSDALRDTSRAGLSLSPPLQRQCPGTPS